MEVTDKSNTLSQKDKESDNSEKVIERFRIRNPGDSSGSDGDTPKLVVMTSKASLLNQKAKRSASKRRKAVDFATSNSETFGDIPVIMSQPVLSGLEVPGISKSRTSY